MKATPAARSLPGAWSTERVVQTLWLLRTRRPSPCLDLLIARIEGSI